MNIFKINQWEAINWTIVQTKYAGVQFILQKKKLMFPSGNGEEKKTTQTQNVLYTSHLKESTKEES